MRPALELADSRVFRFDSPDLTADSAYFTSTPFLEAAGLPLPLHGSIRAGVCLKGDSVCRVVTLEL